MTRPRLARYRALIFEDDTRPVEFLLGLCAVGMAAWMFMFPYAPLEAVHILYWHPWDAWRTLSLGLGGATALVMVGSEWRWLRMLTAYGLAYLFAWMAAIFAITAPAYLSTFSLAAGAVAEVWVAYRLHHDGRIAANVERRAPRSG